MNVIVEVLSELIFWVLLVLGGAIVFGLYYLLYRRTLKNKGSITNTSFVVKAPFFIGCINLIAFVCLFFGIVPLGNA